LALAAGVEGWDGDFAVVVLAVVAVAPLVDELVEDFA
jgi:hypothetical protein